MFSVYLNTPPPQASPQFSACDKGDQLMPAATLENSNENATFVERRQSPSEGRGEGMERRQFVSSYQELSQDAGELARAIDQYKLQHRRRFINFEEMLGIVKSLGYHK